jgi:hypothetical protein
MYFALILLILLILDILASEYGKDSALDSGSM